MFNILYTPNNIKTKDIIIKKLKSILKKNKKSKN